MTDIKNIKNDGFIVLKRKYSELYKKVNYTAPVKYIVNTIYEYDIKMANVSVLRASKGLPEKVLSRIENLTKEERVIMIGNMIRENPKIQKNISKGIIDAKRKLFQVNQIMDSEVLSIKNDAVFIIGRKLKVTKFGPVEFVVKNKYSLYHNIEGLEFYYNSNNKEVTVKGMNDDIINTDDHQNGMLIFLRTVFDYLIYDRHQSLREYLIDFTDQYKSRKLTYSYYREMNSENIYRFKDEIDGYTFNLESVSQDDVKDLNIVYNYKFYVLPIIQQYI